MPEAASVAVTTVLLILVIVNIVGNSLVCWIIKKYQDMRYMCVDGVRGVLIGLLFDL